MENTKKNWNLSGTDVFLTQNIKKVCFWQSSLYKMLLQTMRNFSEEDFPRFSFRNQIILDFPNSNLLIIFLKNWSNIFLKNGNPIIAWEPSTSLKMFLIWSSPYQVFIKNLTSYCFFPAKLYFFMNKHFFILSRLGCVCKGFCSFQASYYFSQKLIIFIKK